MNLNFSLSNDPRRQYMMARDRHAYASQYIANMAMWFKFASTVVVEQDSSILARRVVEQLTVELGFSVSACAKVLRVTRPTVYSWLRQRQAPQTAQIGRLQQVSKAANLVNSYRAQKQEIDLLATLPDGSSVTSILYAEHIDLSRLESSLQTLRDLPVRYLADIPDEVLDAPGEVNSRLLALLKKAPL